jgi:hypothetical protein
MGNLHNSRPAKELSMKINANKNADKYVLIDRTHQSTIK